MDRDPAVTTASTGSYATPQAGVASTPATPALTTPAGIAAPLVAPRDAVRWGPIWAGLLVGIASNLLLSLLAFLIGIETVSRGAIDSQAAAQTGAWVAAVLAVLSFLLGGFVTGRTSAVRGRASGLLNGFLVWALGIVLIALLSAVGLGQLFGALGDLFGNLRQLTADAGQLDQAQIASNLRNSALISFLSMAIPALAASAGGWLGARGGDDAELYVD